MVCKKCETELNEGTKFCTKCGNNVSVEELKNHAIAAIALISIGIILALVFRFVIRPSAENNFLRFIGRFSWFNIRDIFFYGGIILAYISLYKEKNKKILIFGIIAGAIFPFFTLLWMLGL